MCYNAYTIDVHVNKIVDTIFGGIYIMTKKEFIGVIAEKAGVSKKDTEAVYDALWASIIENLKAGEKVQISGFGTFEVRERPERIAKNPRTGEAVKVDASKAPAFKAGKALKDSINN
jgi:DNA-binding protein HU-beta